MHDRQGRDGAGAWQLPLPPLGLWLGEPRRHALDIARFAPGLCAIEVTCAAPCTVTACIYPDDAALAAIVAPLERTGPNVYRTTLSLTGGVREAWLELLPADAATVRSVTIGQLPLSRLAGQAWRAVRRHALAPRTLLAKVRQVAAGHGNLVLASGHVRDGDTDEAYRRWQAAFESPAEHARILAALDARIGPAPIDVIAVIAPDMTDAAAVDTLLASLAACDRARLHVLDLRARHAMPSEAFDRLLARTEAKLVVGFDRPGRFHPMAVVAWSLALATMPEALAATGDHDLLAADGGRTSPTFKPAWSPAYQAACDYVGAAAAFRPAPGLLAAVAEAGGPTLLSSRLLDAIADRAGTDSPVVHVPRVLFHAAPLRRPDRRDGLRSIHGSAAPARRRTGDSLVSVIIPTRDNPDLLSRACRSVREAAGVRTELIVVDNGAQSEAQKALLAQLAAAGEAQIVTDHRPFNFSALINAGRAACRGDVLVLLNDDVEAIEPDWLAELAGAALSPGIGAVGALLLYPDGRVQHAGVLVGINGGAGHALRFADPSGDASDHRLHVAREVAAVTGACLAVRTARFDAAGGFAEDLPVTLNDVDFCLRLRALGCRNLFTPTARLIHRESTTRGLDVTPDKLRRLARETAIFRARWGEAALRDPYLSPHLSPAHEDFRPRRL